MRLGPRQIEWIDWALDAMADYWCEISGSVEREGPLYQESALPIIHGCQLQIDHCPVEIVDDLIDRLRNQAATMAEEEGDDARSPMRLAERLTERLETQ